MLEPILEEINIEKGDIVEIIGEPFKKEKAKVMRIDKTKGEAVVTLLAAVVPIPVTVKLDNVKVIRREKEGEEEPEKQEEIKEELKPQEPTKDSNGESVNILGKAQEDKKNYDEPSGGLIPDEY